MTLGVLLRPETQAFQRQNGSLRSGTVASEAER
jgi:hypothetical protein